MSTGRLVSISKTRRPDGNLFEPCPGQGSTFAVFFSPTSKNDVVLYLFYTVFPINFYGVNYAREKTREIVACYVGSAKWTHLPDTATLVILSA